MRSTGRSRPMSAPLTTKRRSARDRPASSKERERGDRGRESGRCSTEVLVVRDIARAQLGSGAHSPEGSTGPSCLAGSARCSCCILPVVLQPPSSPAAVDDHCSTPSSPSSARPASLLPPPAPSPSRLTHPTDTPLSAAPATHLPLVPPSTPHLCVASERACVRNGGWGVWRAPQ